MTLEFYRICQKKNLKYDEFKEALVSIKNEDINKRFFFQTSLATLCEYNASLDKIKLMVEHGAQADLIDAYSFNNLFYLFRGGCKFGSDVVEYLMSKGCDINLKSKYGNSILHIIILYYEFTIEKLRLLKKFIKTNEKEFSLKEFCQLYPENESKDIFDDGKIKYFPDPKLNFLVDNLIKKNVGDEIIDFLIQKGYYKEKGKNMESLFVHIYREKIIEKLSQMENVEE